MASVDCREAISIQKAARSNLMAIATNLSLEGEHYVPPRTIANAWNQVDPKWCEYFWKNREHGILTFEDELIEPFLDPAHHLRLGAAA